MMNGTPIKYRKYGKEKTAINKNIRFDKDVAERINYWICVFNRESRVIKLTNDSFINIAVSEYMKRLEDTENVITEIKHKAIDFEDK